MTAPTSTGFEKGACLAVLGSLNRLTTGYATADGGGILTYCYHGDGRLSPIGSFPSVANPTFLAMDPSTARLFAVWEVSEWSSGFISAFEVDNAGHLALINSRRSHGGSACHLTVARSTLLVSNYAEPKRQGGVSVAAWQLAEDGSIGELEALITTSDSLSAAGGHAHSVTMSPDGQFAVLADLGLDALLSYRFPFETFHPVAETLLMMPHGSGPRHAAFHPNMDLLYVVCELSNSLSTCSYKPLDGSLSVVSSQSTLPEKYWGQSACADLTISPDGQFLYVTNRGHDSIAMFRLQAGLPELLGHRPSGGRTPRSCTFDPAGRFLFVTNQDSNSVVVFEVAIDGTLREARRIATGSPMRLLFAP